MVWKIGPECVAQQKKFVPARMRNAGELRTSPTEGSGVAVPVAGAAPEAAAASAGGRRIRNATGIMTLAASAAIRSIEVRQSTRWTSHPANGDIVIGAIPMPADTSDTA